MAQSYDEGVQELSAFIRTEWQNAGESLSVLTYDGLDFTPPQDGSTWARLTIQYLPGSGRASLGGSKGLFRRMGKLTLQVFVSNEVGAVGARQLADPIVLALEDAGQVGNIWFRNIQLREVGVDDVHYQVNVEAEFQFDRTS